MPSSSRATIGTEGVLRRRGITCAANREEVCCLAGRSSFLADFSSGLDPQGISEDRRGCDGAWESLLSQHFICGGASRSGLVSSSLCLHGDNSFYVVTTLCTLFSGWQPKIGEKSCSQSTKLRLAMSVSVKCWHFLAHLIPTRLLLYGQAGS